jgi:DNA-binding MarR family transcriptional regulator
MPRHGWSFLSHHGMVLVALARQADLRLSELALEVGISPRAAQSIVTDLVREGFLERDRIGRRNRYRVKGNRQLPDHWAQDRRIGELVGAIARGRDGVSRPNTERQHALVLACSDHRYQRGLRELLGNLGLLNDAEVVLWPGGSAALTQPGGTVLLELIAAAVQRESPASFVLVSHERCHVGSEQRAPRLEALAVVAEASRRRRRTVELVETTFGIKPDLWYQTDRGARRMGGSRPQMTREKAG